MDARRLLLGGGGLVALVSFFGMTWVDLLLVRGTGFDLLHMGASFSKDQSVYLLILVPLAGLAGIAAALRSERAAGWWAAAAAAAGFLLQLYIASSLSTTILFGQRVSMMGILGGGYWSSAIALGCIVAGAFVRSAPASGTSARLTEHQGG